MSEQKGMVMMGAACCGSLSGPAHPGTALWNLIPGNCAPELPDPVPWHLSGDRHQTTGLEFLKLKRPATITNVTETIMEEVT